MAKRARAPVVDETQSNESIDAGLTTPGTTDVCTNGGTVCHGPADTDVITDLSFHNFADASQQVLETGRVYRAATKLKHTWQERLVTWMQEQDKQTHVCAGGKAFSLVNTDKIPTLSIKMLEDVLHSVLNDPEVEKRILTTLEEVRKERATTTTTLMTK